ncbi:hypothetical protein ACT7DZ_38580 [Bacillus cereus]
MIELETKDKRWQEMREDLGERLVNGGLIKKRDEKYIYGNRTFGKVYGIQVINGTSSQISIEGMSLQFTYDFANYELNVWGTAQRHAGASYGVGELVKMRELLTKWQQDWEKLLDGSK